MKERIEEFLKQKDAFQKEMKEWLKDESIPLEERWEVLTKSGLGLTSWRTDFNLKREDTFLYEGPLYMNKGETYPVKDIFDILNQEDEENPALTEEEKITFKKYCVEGFYSEMCFDW